MSAPTEEEQAAALLAMIAAEDVAVYEVDDLAKMSTPPQEYVEFEFEWRPGATSRQTAQQSASGYRFTTYAIGRTVSNVRESMRRTESAVRSKRLTVGGRTSTPIQRETSDAPREREGRFVGWTTWTYVL